MFSLVHIGNTFTQASVINTTQRGKVDLTVKSPSHHLHTPHPHILHGFSVSWGKCQVSLCWYERVPIPLLGLSLRCPPCPSPHSVSLRTAAPSSPVLWLAGVQPVGVPAGQESRRGERLGCCWQRLFSFHWPQPPCRGLLTMTKFPQALPTRFLPALPPG